MLSSPPSSLVIQQLLASVDAPATYLKALVDRHAAPEVALAMFDVYHTALAYSAQRAIHAGHLSVSHHGSLAKLWMDGDADLEVCTVELFDGMACSDLLVFSPSSKDDLFLYAPGKPDGQEWVELRSLRALSAEVGGWMKDAVGQGYLLAQLPVPIRDRAQARMAAIQALPGEWDLARDIRGALRGYRTCVGSSVQARLQRRQDEVARNESPHWYSQLAIEERQAINLTRDVARVAEAAFVNALKSYESFPEFASRTIGVAIKPYLSSKGVLGSVAPESIVIDLDASGEADRSINLIDLVCYGYDDNSSIDHPSKGGRSLAGDDLSALRSAELASYARRAYIGEKYITHVRRTFLDAGSSNYAHYQQLFSTALVMGMDRDLRVAHGQGQIDGAAYKALTGLVSALGATLRQQNVRDTSEQVAAHDGIFRLTIADHPILG